MATEFAEVKRNHYQGPFKCTNESELNHLNITGSVSLIYLLITYFKFYFINIVIYSINLLFYQISLISKLGYYWVKTA